MRQPVYHVYEYPNPGPGFRSRAVVKRKKLSEPRKGVNGARIRWRRPRLARGRGAPPRRRSSTTRTPSGTAASCPGPVPRPHQDPPPSERRAPAGTSVILSPTYHDAARSSPSSRGGLQVHPGGRLAARARARQVGVVRTVVGAVHRHPRLVRSTSSRRAQPRAGSPPRCRGPVRSPTGWSPPPGRTRAPEHASAATAPGTRADAVRVREVVALDHERAVPVEEDRGPQPPPLTRRPSAQPSTTRRTRASISSSWTVRTSSSRRSSSMRPTTGGSPSRRARGQGLGAPLAEAPRPTREAPRPGRCRHPPRPPSAPSAPRTTPRSSSASASSSARRRTDSSGSASMRSAGISAERPRRIAVQAQGGLQARQRHLVHPQRAAQRVARASPPPARAPEHDARLGSAHELVAAHHHQVRALREGLAGPRLRRAGRGRPGPRAAPSRGRTGAECPPPPRASASSPTEPPR